MAVGTQVIARTLLISGVFACLVIISAVVVVVNHKQHTQPEPVSAPPRATWEMLVKDGDPLGWQGIVQTCREVDALRNLPSLFTEEALRGRKASAVQSLQGDSGSVEILRKYLPPGK